MPWLLLVIVVVAIAAGVYKCSPHEESRLERTLETPERVGEDVEKLLEEGMLRNQRALEGTGRVGAPPPGANQQGTTR